MRFFAIFTIHFVLFSSLTLEALAPESYLRGSQVSQGAVWDLEQFFPQAEADGATKEIALKQMLSSDVATVVASQDENRLSAAFVSMYKFAKDMSSSTHDDQWADYGRNIVQMGLLVQCLSSLEKGSQTLNLWKAIYAKAFPNRANVMNSDSWQAEVVLAKEDDVSAVMVLKLWVRLNRMVAELRQKPVLDVESWRGVVDLLESLDEHFFQGNQFNTYRAMHKLLLEAVALLPIDSLHHDIANRMFEALKRLGLHSSPLLSDKKQGLNATDKVHLEDWTMLLALRQSLVSVRAEADEAALLAAEEQAKTFRELSYGPMHGLNDALTRKAHQSVVSWSLVVLGRVCAKKNDWLNLAEVIATYAYEYWIHSSTYISWEQLWTTFEISPDRQEDLMKRVFRFYTRSLQLTDMYLLPAAHYIEELNDGELKSAWNGYLQKALHPDVAPNDDEQWRENLFSSSACLVQAHRYDYVEENNFLDFTALFERHPGEIMPLIVDLLYVHYAIKFDHNLESDFFKSKVRQLIREANSFSDVSQSLFWGREFISILVYYKTMFLDEEDQNAYQLTMQSFEQALNRGDCSFHILLMLAWDNWILPDRERFPSFIAWQIYDKSAPVEAAALLARMILEVDDYLFSDELLSHNLPKMSLQGFRSRLVDCFCSALSSQDIIREINRLNQTMIPLEKVPSHRAALEIERYWKELSPLNAIAQAMLCDKTALNLNQLDMLRRILHLNQGILPRLNEYGFKSAVAEVREVVRSLEMSSMGDVEQFYEIDLETTIYKALDSIRPLFVSSPGLAYLARVKEYADQVELSRSMGEDIDGDLFVNIPFEDVPVYERELVKGVLDAIDRFYPEANLPEDYHEQFDEGACEYYQLEDVGQFFTTKLAFYPSIRNASEWLNLRYFMRESLLNNWVTQDLKPVSFRSFRHALKISIEYLNQTDPDFIWDWIVEVLAWCDQEDSFVIWGMCLDIFNDLGLNDNIQELKARWDKNSVDGSIPGLWMQARIALLTQPVQSLNNVTSSYQKLFAIPIDDLKNELGVFCESLVFDYVRRMISSRTVDMADLAQTVVQSTHRQNDMWVTTLWKNFYSVSEDELWPLVFSEHEGDYLKFFQELYQRTRSESFEVAVYGWMTTLTKLNLSLEMAQLYLSLSESERAVVLKEMVGQARKGHISFQHNLDFMIQSLIDFNGKNQTVVNDIIGVLVRDGYGMSLETQMKYVHAYGNYFHLKGSFGSILEEGLNGSENSSPFSVKNARWTTHLKQMHEHFREIYRYDDLSDKQEGQLFTVVSRMYQEVVRNLDDIYVDQSNQTYQSLYENLQMLIDMVVKLGLDEELKVKAASQSSFLNRSDVMTLMILLWKKSKGEPIDLNDLVALEQSPESDWKAFPFKKVIYALHLMLLKENEDWMAWINLYNQDGLRNYGDQYWTRDFIYILYRAGLNNDLDETDFVNIDFRVSPRSLSFINDLYSLYVENDVSDEDYRRRMVDHLRYIKYFQGLEVHINIMDLMPRFLEIASSEELSLLIQVLAQKALRKSDADHLLVEAYVRGCDAGLDLSSYASLMKHVLKHLQTVRIEVVEDIKSKKSAKKKYRKTKTLFWSRNIPMQEMLWIAEVHRLLNVKDAKQRETVYDEIVKRWPKEMKTIMKFRLKRSVLRKEISLESKVEGETSVGKELRLFAAKNQFSGYQQALKEVFSDQNIAAEKPVGLIKKDASAASKDTLYQNWKDVLNPLREAVSDREILEIWSKIPEQIRTTHNYQDKDERQVRMLVLEAMLRLKDRNSFKDVWRWDEELLNSLAWDSDLYQLFTRYVCYLKQQQVPLSLQGGTGFCLAWCRDFFNHPKYQADILAFMPPDEWQEVFQEMSALLLKQIAAQAEFYAKDWLYLRVSELMHDSNLSLKTDAFRVQMSALEELGDMHSVIHGLSQHNLKWDDIVAYFADSDVFRWLTLLWQAMEDGDTSKDISARTPLVGFALRCLATHQKGFLDTELEELRNEWRVVLTQMRQSVPLESVWIVLIDYLEHHGLGDLGCKLLIDQDLWMSSLENVQQGLAVLRRVLSWTDHFEEKQRTSLQSLLLGIADKYYQKFSFEAWSTEDQEMYVQLLRGLKGYVAVREVLPVDRWESLTPLLSFMAWEAEAQFCLNSQQSGSVDLLAKGKTLQKERAHVQLLMLKLYAQSKQFDQADQYLAQTAPADLVSELNGWDREAYLDQYDTTIVELYANDYFDHADKALPKVKRLEQAIKRLYSRYPRQPGYQSLKAEYDLNQLETKEINSQRRSRWLGLMQTMIDGYEQRPIQHGFRSLITMYDQRAQYYRKIYQDDPKARLAREFRAYWLNDWQAMVDYALLHKGYLATVTPEIVDELFQCYLHDAEYDRAENLLDQRAVLYAGDKQTEVLRKVLSHHRMVQDIKSDIQNHRYKEAQDKISRIVAEVRHLLRDVFSEDDLAWVLRASELLKHSQQKTDSKRVVTMWRELTDEQRRTIHDYYFEEWKVIQTWDWEDRFARAFNDADWSTLTHFVEESRQDYFGLLMFNASTQESIRQYRIYLNYIEQFQTYQKLREEKAFLTISEEWTVLVEGLQKDYAEFSCASIKARLAHVLGYPKIKLMLEDELKIMSLEQKLSLLIRAGDTDAAKEMYRQSELSVYVDNAIAQAVGEANEWRVLTEILRQADGGRSSAWERVAEVLGRLEKMPEHLKNSLKDSWLLYVQAAYKHLIALHKTNNVQLAHHKLIALWPDQEHASWMWQIDAYLQNGLVASNDNDSFLKILPDELGNLLNVRVLTCVSNWIGSGYQVDTLKGLGGLALNDDEWKNVCQALLAFMARQFDSGLGDVDVAKEWKKALGYLSLFLNGNWQTSTQEGCYVGVCLGFALQDVEMLKLGWGRLAESKQASLLDRWMQQVATGFRLNDGELWHLVHKKIRDRKVDGDDAWQEVEWIYEAGYLEWLLNNKRFEEAEKIRRELMELKRWSSKAQQGLLAKVKRPLLRDWWSFLEHSLIDVKGDQPIREDLTLNFTDLARLIVQYKSLQESGIVFSSPVADQMGRIQAEQQVNKALGLMVWNRSDAYEDNMDKLGQLADAWRGNDSNPLVSAQLKAYVQSRMNDRNLSVSLRLRIWKLFAYIDSLKLDILKQDWLEWYREELGKTNVDDDFVQSVSIVLDLNKPKWIDVSDAVLNNTTIHTALNQHGQNLKHKVDQEHCETWPLPARLAFKRLVFLTTDRSVAHQRFLSDIQRDYLDCLEQMYIEDSNYREELEFFYDHFLPWMSSPEKNQEIIKLKELVSQSDSRLDIYSLYEYSSEESFKIGGWLYNALKVHKESANVEKAFLFLVTYAENAKSRQTDDSFNLVKMNDLLKSLAGYLGENEVSLKELNQHVQKLFQNWEWAYYFIGSNRDLDHCLQEEKDEFRLKVLVKHLVVKKKEEWLGYVNNIKMAYSFREPTTDEWKNLDSNDLLRENLVAKIAGQVETAKDLAITA